MRHWKSLLVLMLAVGFVSSAVYAKRITFKENFSLGSLDATGNIDFALAQPVYTTKTVKFTQSGVVITRVKGKVINLSGKRQVLRNVGFNFSDPETKLFLRSTRDVYRVAKGNKRNFAQARGTGVFKP